MHLHEFEALSEEQLAKIEKDKRTKQYKKLQYKLGFLPLLRRIQQLKRDLSRKRAVTVLRLAEEIGDDCDSSDEVETCDFDLWQTRRAAAYALQLQKTVDNVESESEMSPEEIVEPESDMKMSSPVKEERMQIDVKIETPVTIKAKTKVDSPSDSAKSSDIEVEATPQVAVETPVTIKAQTKANSPSDSAKSSDIEIEATAQIVSAEQKIESPDDTDTDDDNFLLYDPMFEDIKDIAVKIEKEDNIEHVTPVLSASPIIIEVDESRVLSDNIEELKISVDESRVLSDNTGELRMAENEIQASTCQKKKSFADMIEHRKANAKVKLTSPKRKRDKENEDPSLSPRKRKKVNEEANKPTENRKRRYKLRIPNTYNAKGFHSKGCNHLELGRYEKALSDFNKAIELDSSVASYFWSRGRAFLKLDKLVEALADYEGAVRLDPNNAQYWNRRGFVKSQLGRLEEALEDYDKAIELDPQFVKAFYNCGAVLRKLLRWDCALGCYDKAVSLDSTMAKAFNARGKVLRKLGRWEEALESHAKAAELDPTHSKYSSNLRSISRKISRRNAELAEEEKWDPSLEEDNEMVELF